MSVLLSLAFAASAAPSQSVRIPLSIFMCKSEGLPTLTLDLHDDHRMAKFAQFGKPDVEFFVVDPAIDATRLEGAGNGWLVRASGKAAHSVGIADGTPVTLELSIQNAGTGRMSYGISIKAGDLVRHEVDCLSPPPPPSHLPERIK